VCEEPVCCKEINVYPRTTVVGYFVTSSVRLFRLGLLHAVYLTTGGVRDGTNITGSAVALHCCKVHSIGKMENSTPCKIVTPEKFILKLVKDLKGFVGLLY